MFNLCKNSIFSRKTDQFCSTSAWVVIFNKPFNFFQCKNTSSFIYKLNTKNKFDYLNKYSEHYKQTICKDFLYKKNFKNIFEIPKIQKIVLNITYKNIINDKKSIIPGLLSLELICNQKLKWTSAHKSIASFKLRKNQIIGCKVDLRNENMYSFVEKLVTIVLPRIREFKGISLHIVNKKAHVSLGLSEILIFPELENYFEYFEFLKGIDITIVTNANIYSNKKNNIIDTKKITQLTRDFKNQSLSSNKPTLITNQNKACWNSVDSLLLTFLSGFQFPVKLHV